MADKQLNGVNWNTSGDWAPVNEPATADDVRIADSPRDIITGDQGGVDVNSLLVPSRYVGSFGTSGSPLQIAGSLIRYFARGGFFYESDAGGATLRTDEIRIDAADSAVKVEIGSNAADPGYVDKVIWSRCNGLLKGNVKLDTIGIQEVLKEATLTIAAGIGATYGQTAIPVVQNQGGTVKCDSAITTMRLMGGEHTQDTAKIVNGDVFFGTLIYNHAAVTGDATVLKIGDGGTLVLDANSKLKRLTTVWLFPGSRIIPSRPDGITHIIDNLYDLRR